MQEILFINLWKNYFESQGLKVFVCESDLPVHLYIENFNTFIYINDIDRSIDSDDFYLLTSLCLRKNAQITLVSKLPELSFYPTIYKKSRYSYDTKHLNLVRSKKTGEFLNGFFLQSEEDFTSLGFINEVAIIKDLKESLN